MRNRRRNEERAGGSMPVRRASRRPGLTRHADGCFICSGQSGVVRRVRSLDRGNDDFSILSRPRESQGDPHPLILAEMTEWKKWRVANAASARSRSAGASDPAQ
jgi:hypothetical protein